MLRLAMLLDALMFLFPVSAPAAQIPPSGCSCPAGCDCTGNGRYYYVCPTALGTGSCQCPSCPRQAVPDEMPVGRPPGPGFAWRHLPGIGYGWVHSTVDVTKFTAPARPAAVAPAYYRPAPLYYLPAAGGCPNGQCPLPRR